MDFLQYVLSSPANFFGFLVVSFVVFVFYNTTTNNLIRMYNVFTHRRNIQKHGWPPAHYNANDLTEEFSKKK